MKREDHKFKQAWDKIVKDLPQEHLDRLKPDVRHAWLEQWGIPCKCRKCTGYKTETKS